MSGKKVINGGVVLLVAQLGGQLCALGRNVLIARLISPADFGIASIFVVTVSMLEMVSNLNLDRLLIQAKDGDCVDLQETAQFLQVTRGVLSGIILLILAWPLSRLFSIPETFASFAWLGLVPVFAGAQHLDPKRVQRNMRFLPFASIELCSQIISLLMIWLLILWIQDYRLMLCVLIFKFLCVSLGSHLVAERPYRWSCQRENIKRFLSFGWPLLLNGVLMYLILQSDRVLLASAKQLFDTMYEMADVGIYSAAFIITMSPAMILMRSGSTLFLPILSAVNNDSNVFWSQAQQVCVWFAGVVISFFCILSILGDKIFLLIYGEKYVSGSRLIFWFGMMWFLRMLRVIPSVIALAHGKTKLLLYCNIVRVVFTVCNIFVVMYNMELIWLIAINCVGELCAFVFSQLICRQQLNMPKFVFKRTNWVCVLFFFLVCGYKYVETSFYIEANILFWIGGLLLLHMILVWALPELRMKLTYYLKAHRSERL